MCVYSIFLLLPPEREWLLKQPNVHFQLYFSFSLNFFLTQSSKTILSNICSNVLSLRPHCCRTFLCVLSPSQSSIFREHVFVDSCRIFSSDTHMLTQLLPTIKIFCRKFFVCDLCCLFTYADYVFF